MANKNWSEGLLGNPMFMMGLAGLANQRNPAQGWMQGLLANNQYTRGNANRASQEEMHDLKMQQIQQQMATAQAKAAQTTRLNEWAIKQFPNLPPSLAIEKFKAENEMNGKAGFGVSPFYATGPKGKLAAFQLSNRGGATRVNMPEGYTPARPNKMLDLGNQYVAVNPMTNQPVGAYEKGLGPDQTTEYKSAVKVAEKTGTATGEATTQLADREAGLPHLEVLVQELEGLGEKATYTSAGQLANATKRQLGLDVGEGAIARKEYISKVDNEILPLLRETFGAQFTATEGESLKATLGDKDASPEEKSAVLRSFIATKRAQIKTLHRRVGLSEPRPAAPGAAATTDWQEAARAELQRRKAGN